MCESLQKSKTQSDWTRDVFPSLTKEREFFFFWQRIDFCLTDNKCGWEKSVDSRILWLGLACVHPSHFWLSISGYQFSVFLVQGRLTIFTKGNGFPGFRKRRGTHRTLPASAVVPQFMNTSVCEQFSFQTEEFGKIVILLVNSESVTHMTTSIFPTQTSRWPPFQRHEPVDQGTTGLTFSCLWLNIILYLAHLRVV